MTLLLLLAVLPAIVLIRFVYRLDKIEKEPRGLLIKLFLGGALSTVFAVIFGTLLEAVNIFDEGTTLFLIFDNFIATALVEECGKYLVMKKLTWKNREFNYSFDAVVYAVVTSLGFATLENILYVFEGGIAVALMRAVLSVPGHAIFGVFMGYHYGLSKRNGRVTKATVLIPMLIHGFYDFCLSTESTLMIVIFIAFELIISLKALAKVKKLSAEDSPV